MQLAPGWRIVPFMRALELFAGIGGLALALPRAVQLVAAFDQDEAARRTHALNHGVQLAAFDLATVAEREIARHEADSWLMSPPCQPFTRRGHGRDVDDPRCRALLRLIELIPSVRPRRVVVENVVGFHGSRAHARLVTALRAIEHEVADVESCPTQLGWPVRRPRQFVVSSADGLAPEAAPGAEGPRLEALLDAGVSEELLVPPAWRARVEPVVPVAPPLPTITRSYGHAIDGAGPLVPSPRGPRFLSPDEILRLHAFPASFRWPEDLPLRTRWRLAGNSVHVASAAQVLARWGCCEPLRHPATALPT